MALSRRPLPLLCRLLLALWVFACAAGSIEGCLAEAPSAAGPAVLSASPSDARDPEASHHASCQSFCASLGNSTTASPSEAAPLPTPLLMLWLLLPVIIAPLCRHGRASRSRRAAWPATSPPSFLLFQRFNK